jgi:DNA-binding PadR family transcriptional regulator
MGEALMKMTISPEPALLGVLRGGPIHGYELYKRVTEELAPIWHLGRSQMYAIVNDYAARGWIRTRVEVQGLRPSKKILELTPAGRKAFEAWMAQPARGLREFRVDFFARLYFARSSGRAKMEHLINQQIAESRQELQRLEKGILLPQNAEDEFRQAVRNFRIEQLRAALHWLETHRRHLMPAQTRTKSMRVRVTSRAARK